MAKPNQFRLRWKGAITGPFALMRISEMLRSGEISLVHNIEVNDNWTTLRDYFRTLGNERPGGFLPPVFVNSDNQGQDQPPLPPGAPGSQANTAIPPQHNQNAAGEALERNVREGYLWCGSTFLFPPLFAVTIPLWEKMGGGLQPPSKFTLFIFATLVGCTLPLWLVQRVGRQIALEGLAEIAQAQLRLCLILAGLGAVFWVFMFYLLAYAKP